MIFSVLVLYISVILWKYEIRIHFKAEECKVAVGWSTIHIADAVSRKMIIINKNSYENENITSMCVIYKRSFPIYFELRNSDGSHWSSIDEVSNGSPIYCAFADGTPLSFVRQPAKLDRLILDWGASPIPREDGCHSPWRNFPPFTPWGSSIRHLLPLIGTHYENSPRAS